MSAKAYKQERWNLSDLYSSIDSPEVQKAQQNLETILKEFEGYRDQLRPDLDEKTFLASGGFVINKQ